MTDLRPAALQGRVLQGGIDGRLQNDQLICFSFKGMDEHHEVNGAGMLTLNGNQLTFVLMYHQGHDFTFECERRG